MPRSILGFLILIGIIGSTGAYAYFYYNDPDLADTPHQELSIPQRDHKARQKSDKPMQDFEKKMDKRLQDRKSGGVDLSKNKLNEKKHDSGH